MMLCFPFLLFSRLIWCFIFVKYYYSHFFHIHSLDTFKHNDKTLSRYDCDIAFKLLSEKFVTKQLLPK